jgi:phosphotriesterase-related protein
VFRVALPHLRELSRRGCRTLIECTPAYIGRDVALLRRLSRASGLHLITNTGYYGAADDKYVPAHAFGESAERLSERWVEEHRDGIEGTDVHPGFQKIGVDAGPLSEIDGKLVEAAGRCHLSTGLSIAVHTGDGTAATEIIASLKRQGVSPRAYVWVHAQNESSRERHVRAAEAGAFVEFDGISERGLAGSVQAVCELLERGHGSQVLVSQDAGWYHVGEAGGGNYRGYAYLFDSFLPALRAAGVSEAQIQALLVDNPRRAFQLGIRREG